MQVQAVDGALAERIRAREIADAHFTAELSNDPETILTSVKSYPPLVTAILSTDDAGRPRLVQCATPAEQRTFYEGRCARTRMTRFDLFTTIGTDWYAIVHGVQTWEASASGRDSIEFVGLLPPTADEETIAGEIGLGWPMGIGKLGDPPGQVASERVTTLGAHNSWLDAFRLGDPDRLGAAYADGAIVSLQDPVSGETHGLHGRDAVTGYYRRLLADATVTGADLVLRMIDRWFAITELSVHLEHRTSGNVITRLADICVMDADDKILVQVGMSSGAS